MFKYNLNLSTSKYSLKQIILLSTTKLNSFSAVILLFCLPALPATKEDLCLISTTEQPFHSLVFQREHNFRITESLRLEKTS